MINQVVEFLKANNLSIGSVESLTGGLFASTLTSIPGVSSIYKGSVVTYATEIKENVVGVSKNTVNCYGVVSKECAYEMALNGKKLLNTDIVISFTGNAGPSVMEGKEVGKVFIGLAYKDEVETYELTLSGNREEIRKECIKIGFIKIFNKITRTF